MGSDFFGGLREDKNFLGIQEGARNLGGRIFHMCISYKSLLC